MVLLMIVIILFGVNLSNHGDGARYDYVYNVTLLVISI